MSTLKPFQLPQESRLVRKGDALFKFKLDFETHDPLPCSQKEIDQELRKVLLFLIHSFEVSVQVFSFCSFMFNSYCLKHMILLSSHYYATSCALYLDIIIHW